MASRSTIYSTLSCCKNVYDWQLTCTRSLSTSAKKYRYMSAQDRDKSRLDEAKAAQARAMERYFTHEWKAGDVYAPHDLSSAEARKWKVKHPPTTDAFDALSLNPIDLYKNFSVMSEYVTEMGRIRHSNQTGLRAVNQRKIAKAIRRAIGIGIMPSVHRHPEIVKEEVRKEKERIDFR